MSIILGFLAGVGLPIQTSVNTRLRKKVGSPYNASLVSFVVALLFLSALLLITGQGLHIPLAQLLNEPAWIWIGGICGLVFLTGNILLFSKLGGVQTVVLPVLGQILMGLIIDNFGLFYSQKTPLSVFRIAGAVMVILGVVLVSMAKENKTASEKLQKSESTTLWIWRAFGIFAGMLSATQIAVNGYLGKVVGSPIKASAISFTVGIIFLAIICIVLHFKNGKSESFKNESAETVFSRRRHRSRQSGTGDPGNPSICGGSKQQCGDRKVERSDEDPAGCG